jgi:hypothetical protein
VLTAGPPAVAGRYSLPRPAYCSRDHVSIERAAVAHRRLAGPRKQVTAISSAPARASLTLCWRGKDLRPWHRVMKAETIRVEFFMINIVIAVAVAVLSGQLVAQEEKPVPKDSVRVTIPGCTKGYIFTAGRRTPDQPGSVDIPEGLHMRMSGPKKVIADIKAHEGSMVEITGLVKRGQYNPGGVGIGGGVRITPGPAPTGGSVSANPIAGQLLIDVEGWRTAVGNCPSR